MKSARITILNNEIDFILLNEGLQSSRYVTGIFNNLYTDHSAIYMRLSSDPNDVFHFVSSENTYIINEYMRKSSTSPNTQLP